MRLSGQQAQALVWVAFKDTPKPSARALAQIRELGLARAPLPGRDPHWRLTDDGGRMLRERGLSRERVGKRRGATA